MAEFDMKLIPKDKSDLTKFKNFQMGITCPFDELNGKVVYCNFDNPDSNIYSPYFVKKGNAYKLRYYIGENGTDAQYPLLTLQELNYEDYILYYTAEDVTKNKSKK